MGTIGHWIRLPKHSVANKHFTASTKALQCTYTAMEINML